jgi:Leucine-rich repeat (LRR) protein
MPIAVKCSCCGQAYRVSDAAAGKTLKCKKCTLPIQIPAAGATAPPPPAQAPLPPAEDPPEVIEDLSVPATPAAQPTRKPTEPPPPTAPAAAPKRRKLLIAGCLAAVFVVPTCCVGLPVGGWVFFRGSGGGTSRLLSDLSLTSKEEKPAELPPALVRAWAAGGAQPGYMTNRGGWLDYDLEMYAGKGAKPAFLFLRWKPGVIATLPQPADEFGIAFDGNATLSDRDLAELAALEKLRWLDVHNMSLKDAGFQELARINQLEALDLHHSQVTARQIRLLAPLQRLQSLNLSECNSHELKDAGLRELAAFKQLKILRLAPMPLMTDAGMAHLADLSELELLTITHAEVSDTGVKQLARLRKLRALHLQGVPMTNAALRDIATLPELRELDITVTGITDAGLAELAGAKKLEALDVSFTNITDAGLQHLGSLPKLTWLKMVELKAPGRVTGAGLAALARCEHLEDVFCPRGMNDECLEGLAKIKSLKYLYLGNAHVTDAGLSQLAQLPNLEYLDIRDTTVNDTSLKEIAKIKRLKFLNVKSTKVTEAGRQELLKVFPDLVYVSEGARTRIALH